MASYRQNYDEELREKGILVNYVNPITIDGKGVWALGSRLYHDRPVPESFEQFIVGVLINELGNEWWDENRYSESPHFIMKCYLSLYDVLNRTLIPENQTENGIYAIDLDGYSKYLLSLAYDVASLVHSTRIPNILMKRLRNRDQFQGARYEIAIAAIFARLDFEIDFLDERVNPTQKRCDFIVKNRVGDVKIAIEAKSRHRKGIIHQKGNFSMPETLQQDLCNIFRKAMLQATEELPFIIFIDINLPPTPELYVLEKTWIKSIQSLGEEFLVTTENKKSRINMVIVTNFSDHYREKNRSTNSEFIGLKAIHTVFSHADDHSLEFLEKALHNYGFVPSIINNGSDI